VIDLVAPAPKLPLHKYDAPPVAVTLIAVVVQFNSVALVLLVMPAVGAAVFPVITMLFVAVQPFVPVTVTVYVPAVVTFIVAVVAPLLHKYDAPPVAVTLIEVVVQVSSVTPVLFVMAAVGAAVFSVITMLFVSVQPFAFVTVTVYVPAAIMFIAAVVAPLLHEYVSPPVAVTLIEVVVQVSSVVAEVFVMAAMGLFAIVTFVCAVCAAQPFAAAMV
jgi:hypothetical protein